MNSSCLIQQLPSAYTKLDYLHAIMVQKSLILFLDYDGTLTEIAPTPQGALLSNAMRHTLLKLSHCYPIYIISGRDRSNLMHRVGLEALQYIGAHGLDMTPMPSALHGQVGDKVDMLLSKVALASQQALSDLSGILLERKKYSVAIHYRQAPDGSDQRVQVFVQQYLQSEPELRMLLGKKVVEITLNIDWNKGSAVQCVLQRHADAVPIYIGDDITDESGFLVVKKGGLGVVVGNQDRPTQATCRLDNPLAVADFLERLI